MVSDEIIRSGSLGPIDEISKFEAEIMGLSMALNEALRATNEGMLTYTGVFIFSDTLS
ncbi:hypothetical protein CROQUDRAFT_652991, partial [Cronartium quercuum f. sp. fusiforme G11]